VNSKGAKTRRKSWETAIGGGFGFTRQMKVSAFGEMASIALFSGFASSHCYSREYSQAEKKFHGADEPRNTPNTRKANREEVCFPRIPYSAVNASCFWLRLAALCLRCSSAASRLNQELCTVKKVLLICSHLQQFSKIISPPNRPLPAPQ
jgi:hypothetical protein